MCCCEKSTFRPRERLSGAERSEAANFFWPFCSFGAAFLPQASAKSRHNAGGALAASCFAGRASRKKSALQAKQIKVTTGGNIDDVASDGKATDGPRPSWRRYSLVFEDDKKARLGAGLLCLERLVQLCFAAVKGVLIAGRCAPFCFVIPWHNSSSVLLDGADDGVCFAHDPLNGFA